jgi:hypothetical protein
MQNIELSGLTLKLQLALTLISTGLFVSASILPSTADSKHRAIRRSSSLFVKLMWISRHLTDIH